MSKNKNKNKNNNQSSKNSASNVAPTIVVKSANEIVTTEEGEQLLNDSLSQMEEYCSRKRDEADKYYEDKKADADKLEETKQDQIDRAVDDAVKKKEKEMKDQVHEAKEEAKKIIDDAKEEAKSSQQDLDNKQKALDEKLEAYTKDLATLESSKVTYKQEVLNSINAEMKAISDEKNNLEKEIDELKKANHKKDSDIKALTEDKKFYEEELSNNAIKKSQIASYELKIEQLNATIKSIEELYKEQQATNQSLRTQILQYGDDPQKALKDIEELTKKNNELQSLISNCPSKEAEYQRRLEELNNKLEAVEAERLRLQTENNDLRVNKDEIEDQRKFIKILELQKSELQKELERNIELYNTSTQSVFASLSTIDKLEVNSYPHNSINLYDLCEKFKGYLANRPTNPLYYDNKTIRTFIAGFASSRLMILEGLSGTGKSSLPRAFSDFIGSHTIEVPVQSSWKDRNDLLGFYNDFKKQYKETEFLKALYTATHDPNNIYVIVLDEMNLSRIEYYFADLLSVLEKPNVEDWKIELISDYASIAQNSKDAWPKLIHEGKLQICDNTWFIGTANKDDSTFIITDKVYDRSVVLNFDKKGEKEKVANANPIHLNSNDFQALLKGASHFKNQTDENRYNELINFLDSQIKDNFEITFGNRIANQLETFVPVYIECGGTVDEAVDVMFSRKVLRKLEGIYDEDTKLKLEMLKEEINKKYKMPISIKTIEKMVAKI